MERFMELYRTVYKDLYRLAYYYVGNAADAEDLVQEAVLAAYENFGKLREEEAFRVWIFRILTNCCRKHFRKNRRTEAAAESPEGFYEPELSAGTQVRELLGSLSKEERLIVVLTVFGGYKSQEIARMLKKNHSTVRSKYRRALKKLELELRQEVRR
ncbi:MAG: RNA polymerase sigma factor [Lachnospiraceae bacterium]|nr:RNA polymerase sigma factor [Lachnospiraceae bacterium]